MATAEEWRSAVSSRFPDLVQDMEVSNFGNVRKMVGKKLYKQGNKDNYRMVRRQNKTIYVHTLVAETFLQKRPDNLVIDHIDGNKYNNHVSNLRYVSHGYNGTKQDRKEVVKDDGSVSFQRVPRHWRENLQRGIEGLRKKIEDQNEEIRKLYEAMDTLKAIVKEATKA